MTRHLVLFFWNSNSSHTTKFIFLNHIFLHTNQHITIAIGNGIRKEDHISFP